MKEKLLDLLKRKAPLILHWAKTAKKLIRRQHIEQQKRLGKVISRLQIVVALRKIGIQRGDILLVHSSLRKLGVVDGDAATVVQALLEVLGPEGTLLMPTFPHNVPSMYYLEKEPVFDLNATPSSMGAISEYFRKLPGTMRSLHPTHPVAARGPMAEELTKDHFGQLVPFNEHSPFYKLTKVGGKILYMGVTLQNAGTNLHTLEDAVDFRYPAYLSKVYDTQLIDEKGNLLRMKTKVHNPEYSLKRECDELIPMFEKEGAMTRGKVALADTLLFDAKKMHDSMLRNYLEKGITMYTPHGI